MPFSLSEVTNIRTLQIIKKGDIEIAIKRVVKPGTNRVFFFPSNADGKNITKTFWSRKAQAVTIARNYLKTV